MWMRPELYLFTHQVLFQIYASVSAKPRRCNEGLAIFFLSINSEARADDGEGLFVCVSGLCTCENVACMLCDKMRSRLLCVG